MPTNDEILEASKELEEMIELPLPPFTLLQKKINNKSFPLISDGLSRISNYYLKKNANFF